MLRQPWGSERQRVITQTSLWSWSNALHTVWPNPLCVFVHALIGAKRDLCYIHQLFYLGFLKMIDAFSEIMDNNSKGKIYNWRRTRHSGLCLRTDKILRHIHKTNFGTMVGFVICVEIFNLCTLSASPPVNASEISWWITSFTRVLKMENALLNAEKTLQW